MHGYEYHKLQVGPQVRRPLILSDFKVIVLFLRSSRTFSKQVVTKCLQWRPIFSLWTEKQAGWRNNRYSNRYARRNFLQRSLLVPNPPAEIDTWIWKRFVALGGKVNQKTEYKLRPTEYTGVAVTIVRLIWEKNSSSVFRDSGYTVCGDLFHYWVSLWKFINTSSNLVI